MLCFSFHECRITQPKCAAQRQNKLERQRMFQECIGIREAYLAYLKVIHALQPMKFTVHWSKVKIIQLQTYVNIREQTVTVL